MKLIDFVAEFIEINSIVRLVYKVGGGHKCVAGDWDIKCMEWEITNKKGIYKKYINNDVICIASISVDGDNYGTINIVIQELGDDEIRDIVLENIGI